MKKENYYALVNYRGKNKYYFIYASENNPKGGIDIRIEYIDYNPNREWTGVWIKDGQDKIIQKFNSKSKEYKYFIELNKKWNKLNTEHSENNKKHYNLEKVDTFIGTSNFFKNWKQALKETPNTLNIIL